MAALKNLPQYFGALRAPLQQRRAALGHDWHHPELFRVFRLLPFGYGFTQDVLDLAVNAAEFIGRPFFEIVPECRRQSQEEWFAFISRHTARAMLGIQRAGVDYRTNFGFAAEHNQKIAHHRRFAFFIQIDDVFRG